MNLTRMFKGSVGTYLAQLVWSPVAIELNRTRSLPSTRRHLRLAIVVVGLAISMSASSQQVKDLAEHYRSLDISKLERMAEGGDPDANLILGFEYFSGWRVAMDRHKALSYYLVAANLRSAMAMGNICNMYHYGLGVNRDDRTAYGWCEKAATLGSANAMVMIAEMARDDGGLMKSVAPKSREELVFQFCEMAANRDHMVGQFELGYCFEKGTGTEQNLEKAISLYEASSNQGYAPAIAALKRLRP
jgi:TPR repeat protein